MLWKLFFEAMLIHIELGIRRADVLFITIAHKNNKNNVLVISDPELRLPLIHICFIDRLIEWWLMNNGCGEMGCVADTDECPDVGWILMFDVWYLVCDVTCSEGEFEADWLASMWLAGRLLRSAVMFAPMKQYGHVLSIVVWLTHG